MAKGYRAEFDGMGYHGPAVTDGPHIYLKGKIVDGLKSGVGRPVWLEMPPEQAARVAWRFLAEVARNFPELAKCEHKHTATDNDHPRGPKRCVTCHAQIIEGLRTVYSPAVPIQRGDDVRLSLSYLERMNDVKLREAAEAVLAAEEKVDGPEWEQALRSLEEALTAARKPEHFVADTPSVRRLDWKPGAHKWVWLADDTLGGEYVIERDENVRGEGWWYVAYHQDPAGRRRKLDVKSTGPKAAKEVCHWDLNTRHAYGGPAPVAREPKDRGEHESQQSIRRARTSRAVQQIEAVLTKTASGKILHRLNPKAQVKLICVYNGRPHMYTSRAPDVEARARKLQARGVTDFAVRGAGHKQWHRFDPPTREARASKMRALVERGT